MHEKEQSMIQFDSIGWAMFTADLDLISHVAFPWMP